MTDAVRHPIKWLLFIWRARLWPWLSPVLGWLVVVYLSATMLIKYDTDTTDISGAVFVVVAVLAGLAFTYAGVLPDAGRDRADVIYAGECFCQGAMIFLFASLLKYATIVVPAQIAEFSAWIGARSVGGSELDLFVFGMQLVLFLFFVNGLLVTQKGYKTLARVLGQRTSRRHTTEGYFPPAE